MKFKKMIMKLLGLSTLTMRDSKMELSAEQMEILESYLGKEDASLLISQVNEELAEVKTAKQELQEVKTALAEKEEDAEVKANTITALEEKVEQLVKEKADLSEKVTKLSNEPETEISAIVEKIKEGTMTKVFAIAGQLFGLEGKVWDISAPWNASALNGAKGSTTDFGSSAVIQRMNDDFLDYVRQYPEKIETLFNEYFKLPEHWPRVTGVMDRLMTATISVANVTQPRKARWAPKGDIVFKAEEMRVYPTQIDLQFNYWEMQKIETNWLNGFNKVGNQAYKMPFIAFLLMEFLKKARQEDADVLIRGVHVETPEDREKDKPAHYLFRANGLLKLIFDAKTAGKYRPFNLGAWSFAGAVDYIDNFIKQLPENVRNTEQLQMVLAPSKVLDYKRRYEQIYGGNTDYTGYPETPKDYQNIKFVPVPFLEGSDLILVTTMDNIKILEYKPEEKSLFTIEKFLRDVYAFADYRLGIGINHIGLATVEGDPLALVKQVIWTNNVPMFSSNFFATSYDDKTGILKVNHNRIKPDVDFTTDIREISGNVGDLLIIRGDISLGSAVKVKHSTKIKLASNADFNLKLGGDLTLIRVADGTYKEVSRTAEPYSEVTTMEFDSSVLDYKADNHSFVGSGATTLTKINGGVEGNRLRIYGGANALTVNNVAGNIKVDSQCVLNNAAKYLDLVFVNGIWTELGRG
ncbi:coiled-coil domain-containing protein [Bergeyella zoohelcum]|uniref:Uncharacterized protein n=1 Tax=Bergeyella zoohelcum TaxID=1015 RepID=A0A7Z8YQM9_9FLAO|nr:hypothetical protein [Bergeyella zoohelcum]VDH05855.1 Uncharacterised protein [Bergeyella zoohelcum]